MLLLVVSLLHLATVSCLSSELRVHGSQGGADHEEVQVPFKFKRNLSNDYSAALVKTTTDEAHVLLDFKIRLSSTIELADWTAINSQKLCNWTGIHCDPLKHNVVSIQLDHLELEGTITPMLGQLKHLQLLNLSGNYLEGPIPDSLGQLQMLHSLDLSHNHLNGSIPTSLGNCTRQEFLNLSWNYDLSGYILDTLGQLTMLRELQISNNGINGMITPMLGQLKHLQLLDLSSNYLEGPIPESIGQLQMLHSLDLSYNDLNVSIPASLGNCTRLEVLNLSGNNDLSGYILDTLGQLTMLRELHISQNGINGTITPMLGQLKHLQLLDLYDNQLQGPIPDSLGQLKHLQFLDLSYNQFQGPISDSLGQLQMLQDLDLSGNYLNGSIPLANCTRLEVLDLSFNNFESTVISRLPASLRTLLLMGNNLEDVNLPSSLFLNCTLLEEIHLQQNNLTAEILVSIGNLKNLQWLALSDNNLTGNFPNLSDQAFSKLEYLFLINNNLSGGLPNPALFPSLIQIDLAYNSFSGSIPTNWSSSLKNMRLSHNQLRGPIPFMHQLWILDLSNNQLDNMPASLGLRCSALEALMLSNNNLSGLLPSSLGNCSSLYRLELSNNRLEGEIFKDVLAQLEYLSILDIANNRFTGDIVLRDSNYTTGDTLPEANRFTGERKLVETIVADTSHPYFINLGHNNFSGSISLGVCKCSHLEFLSLTSNDLQGSIPSCITNLTKIRFLDLSSNHLTGLIPRNLGRLLALTVNFHHTFFESKNTGFDNTGFDMIKDGLRVRYEEMFSEMALFDLSNNSLEGEIPATLGQLSGIIFLNLSHNNLSGTIPSELSNIFKLESLDLSHNHLEGHIPSSIASLGLSTFSVANNNLSGPIPTADSFNTRFNVSSFEGNPDLHGCPLQPCAWGSQPRRPTPPIQQHMNEDEDQQNGLFAHFSAWSFFSAALNL